VDQEAVPGGSDRASPQTPTALKTLLTRGAAWKIGSQTVGQAVNLATTIVLVHLLAPADYGLATMALVLVAFVVAFSDLGLGSALVQRPSLTSVDTSTCFWISVGAGVLFSLATAAAAEPLGLAYGNRAVVPLILAISPVFFLDSLATTQRALLARAVDFRSLEIRSLFAALAGSAAAVAAALEGAGAWALVIQQLVLASVSVVVLWGISDWRPSFEFSGQSLRELGAFAWRTTGTSTLRNINDTADNILVGRFLGAAPLGIYSVTYKTALRPMTGFVLPLQEVLFPVLSRAQANAARVGQGWLRVTRVTSAAALPLLAGLAIVAHPFVHVVLGAKWASAGTLIQILAIVGASQVLTASSGSVLAALGRMRVSLRLSAARTVLNVSAFAAGLHWGLVGVAAAYAASSVIMIVPTSVITARYAHTPPLDFLRAIAGSLQAAALMAIALLPLRHLLIAEGAGALLRLVVLTLAGGIVFTVSIWWRDRTLRAEVRQIAGVSRRRADGALPSES